IHSQEFLGNPDPLKQNGDIASQLVSGVDRFLIQEIQKANSNRVSKWQNQFNAAKNPAQFFQNKQRELRHLLGIRDARIDFESPELISSLSRPSLLGRSATVEIHAIRIPVLEGITLEGLLLQPSTDSKTNPPVQGYLVVIPDADQTPETLAGLNDELPESQQVALQLAHQGFKVVVPSLLSRQMTRRNNRANLTHREFIYRSAFELGRHLIGYEIQKILAVVDWYRKVAPQAKIGVWGTGEGGMIALYAAAVDPRIDRVAIDDYLGGREKNWHHPISRNVFGLLNNFGDAELLAMIAPRTIVHLHHPNGITINLPSQGGAPAELRPATVEEVKAVFRDLKTHEKNLSIESNLWSAMERKNLRAALEQFSGVPVETRSLPKLLKTGKVDAAARMARQISEMDRFNQRLLQICENTRKTYFKNLDTHSLETFKASAEPYREKFATEVIGRFDLQLKPQNPRARKFCDKEKYVGFEVVLDVFDEVIAYGIILIPKGIQPQEKRPVVVCQHGLEGRPQDIVQGDHPAYHDFAAKLAEEGFITFSPQNLYIFKDRFRTLQRKANTIGKTLFSVIVPQHQQIVNWLKKLPNVDPKRIAFYGLSYGGKSAMRIPPLVTDYCLSICSADFNEWVWKNASTSSHYSYVFTGEYEIFEFDLGSTFNYAEMATLIAPRPFMVERGHFDGVSSDERVAYEFGKVRHLYQAKLGIGDRCEIEFFVGPHTINGKGTFDFLRKHLNWPASR
ncbi:MAG: dienelactone hydrolase family protein, partial [Planctomycetota bacterium]|nr:dienelactone hydrolase family protein [Planctomycetota bacterium]